MACSAEVIGLAVAAGSAATLGGSKLAHRVETERRRWNGKD